MLAASGEIGTARAWADSSLAGDIESRRPCRSGWQEMGCRLVDHWSNLQSIVALSPGAAELNTVAEGGHLREDLSTGAVGSMEVRPRWTLVQMPVRARGCNSGLGPAEVNTLSVSSCGCTAQCKHNGRM